MEYEVASTSANILDGFLMVVEINGATEVKGSCVCTWGAGEGTLFRIRDDNMALSAL